MTAISPRSQLGWEHCLHCAETTLARPFPPSSRSMSPRTFSSLQFPQIMFDNGEAGAVNAGAGLSMAAPSNLPSAARIAADAKAEYDSRYDGIKPPLPAGIDDQAEMFFQAKELGVYLTEFVDQDVFTAQPNTGHVAVAEPCDRTAGSRLKLQETERPLLGRKAAIGSASAIVTAPRPRPNGARCRAAA